MILYLAGLQINSYICNPAIIKNITTDKIFYSNHAIFGILCHLIYIICLEQGT